ncbi:MAG: FAD-dependent oxidoreductase [Blautia sp.]|jgi:2,4-dienoyl-CoA reductase-like NADH-dependent reductase (Old Yellow Enzyme family)
MKLEYLAKTGKIGNVVTRNRLMMPAMCSYTAIKGAVTDATVNHYARRAEGGVGVIVTEMVNPSPGCQCFAGNLDISNDEFVPGMSRLATAVHAQGAKVFMQLTHGGVFIRNAEKLPQTPSGIGTFSLAGAEVHAMTKDEIHQVVEDYGQAALRAKIAGFDGVELHAGHGYLLVEFLSGYYNHRTDEYGGSVKNRARLSVEIVEAIHKYCGKNFPIIYKIASEDYTPGGITLDQSIQICKIMEDAGVDAIVVSGGTLESRFHDYMDVMNGDQKIDGKMELTKGISTATWIPSTYCPRGIYTDNAAAIKKAVSIPVATVCGVRPEKGNEMIEKGEADFLALGRQILADPDCPNKIMEGRQDEIRQCLRCNECIASAGKGVALKCAINPCMGHDYMEHTAIHKAEETKRIAVIGSGPAGLVAAITAAKKGHQVILFEKSDRLGGLMYYVGKPEFKIDYQKYLDYLLHMLEKSSVEVRKNTEFTVDTAKEENFDKIIAATGSETLVPRLEGVENALNPLDILDGKIPEAKSFIVCGAGLVGCEVSMHLAELGKDVTMIDIVPDAHAAHMYAVDWSINAKLAQDGVRVELGEKILKIEKNAVVCQPRQEKMPHDPRILQTPVDLSGPYAEENVTFTGDAVICALGMKAVNTMAYELKDAGYPVEIIGDAYGARKIIDAVHEGFHAGRRA